MKLIVFLFVVFGPKVAAQDTCVINILIEESPIYFIDVKKDSIVCYQGAESKIVYKITSCRGEGFLVQIDTNGRILQNGQYTSPSGSLQEVKLGELRSGNEEMIYSNYEIYHPVKDGIWYVYNPIDKKAYLINYNLGIIVNKIEIYSQEAK